MNEAVEVLHREFVYVWYYFLLQLRQIAGYWILGMVVGSLVSVFAKDTIKAIDQDMPTEQFQELLEHKKNKKIVLQDGEKCQLQRTVFCYFIASFLIFLCRAKIKCIGVKAIFYDCILSPQSTGRRTTDKKLNPWRITK